ncbi:hypothetical protein [Nostoc sp.]|uniref:hypothetical protein n=1 Tax=Nostoc sp. TaxID=1180 RepID=UPI002FF5EAA8
MITAANVSEQAGAKQVLFKLNQVRVGVARRRHRIGRLIRRKFDGYKKAKSLLCMDLHNRAFTAAIATIE